jgi:hypothetical protein
MSTRRLLGVLLLAAGILALVYRGFSYTKETHDARIGPLEFAFKEKERVEIPVWAGVLLAAAGGALLLGATRKG